MTATTLLLRKMASTIGWSLAAAIGCLAYLFLVPTTIRYHITESYSFRATERDGEICLAVMVPKSGPYQAVSNLKLGGDGVYVTQPQAQVDVVRFTGRVRAGQTNEAIISYDVGLPQGRARWTGPLTPAQRLPQPGIESDQPPIIERARQLVSGQSREDAHQLFRFAAGYLSWPKGSRINVTISATNAYQTRIGGCHEFANLMVALCRASGIPAQTMSGLYFSPVPWSGTRVWGHPGGAHAWVEFNASEVWEMADPSFASFFLFRWTTFGRNDGGHLSYGEDEEHDRVYKQMMDWASTRGKVVGGMSAPLRFAAAAEGGGISVVPKVRVQRSFWDVRWLGLATMVIVAQCIGWRKRRKQRLADIAASNGPPAPSP